MSLSLSTMSNRSDIEVFFSMSFSLSIFQYFILIRSQSSRFLGLANWGKSDFGWFLGLGLKFPDFYICW